MAWVRTPGTGGRGAGTGRGTSGMGMSRVRTTGTGFCGVRAVRTSWGCWGQGVRGGGDMVGTVGRGCPWGWGHPEDSRSGGEQGRVNGDRFLWGQGRGDSLGTSGTGRLWGQDHIRMGMAWVWQWGQVFMKPGLWGHQGQGVCGAGDILGTSGTGMTRVWAAGTRFWGDRAVGALGTGCPQAQGHPGDIRDGWPRGWDHPEDFRNRVAMGSRLQDHPEGAGTTRGQMSLVLGWLGPPLAPSLRFQVELPRSLLALMHVVSPPPEPQRSCCCQRCRGPRSCGPAASPSPRTAPPCRPGWSRCSITMMNAGA